MRAVVARDGRLSWEERPDPTPGGGELLVRVEAAGINAADLLQAQGLYPAPAGSPADVPGLELAGVVVDAGPGVRDFSPDDRVMAVVGGGAQAELAVVHERTALAVPSKVPWDQAGAFPEGFSTAYDALFTQCQLGLGERLLVHGAAGGVGSAAVQLGAAAGARVVATVRHEHLRRDVAEWGATTVGPEDFVELGPFDVVLELVGAPNLSRDLAALATGGRIAVIGVGAGAIAEIDLLALMSSRGRIHGSTLRSRPLEQKAQVARMVDAHVVPLLEAGTVRIPIAQRFPMSRPEAAYAAFAAGGKLGKIVLAAS